MVGNGPLKQIEVRRKEKTKEPTRRIACRHEDKRKSEISVM